MTWGLERGLTHLKKKIFERRCFFNILEGVSSVRALNQSKIKLKPKFTNTENTGKSATWRAFWFLCNMTDSSSISRINIKMQEVGRGRTVYNREHIRN